MAENKCKSDAFSRFPSSVFIERHNCGRLGKYQTQTPQGITVKATLPNMLWSFEHPKANISQHSPNNVGWCCGNMLCSFARGLRFILLNIGLLNTCQIFTEKQTLGLCHQCFHLAPFSLSSKTHRSICINTTIFTKIKRMCFHVDPLSRAFPHWCRFAENARCPGGGGEYLELSFAGYVPLAFQNPYPIIVYSVANYRPHFSHFWANVIVISRTKFYASRLSNIKTTAGIILPIF